MPVVGSIPLSLGQGGSLEEGMATHSSILARRIPWTEEPGELEPVGSQRVGHDRALIHTHTKLLMIQIMLSFFLVSFKSTQ